MQRTMYSKATHRRCGAESTWHTRQVKRFYTAHRDGAVRYTRQLTGNQSLAWDIVHDVFQRLLEKPDLLARIRNEKTWLRTAVRNRAFNRVRDDKNRLRLLETQSAIVRPCRSDPSPETAATLQQATRALSEDVVHLLFCYECLEMTHNEIAAELGCSRRHVGNLLKRAYAVSESLQQTSQVA